MPLLKRIQAKAEDAWLKWRDPYDYNMTNYAFTGGYVEGYKSGHAAGYQLAKEESRE